MKAYNKLSWISFALVAMFAMPGGVWAQNFRGRLPGATVRPFVNPQAPGVNRAPTTIPSPSTNNYNYSNFGSASGFNSFSPGYGYGGYGMGSYGFGNYGYGGYGLGGYGYGGYGLSPYGGFAGPVVPFAGPFGYSGYGY